MSASRCTCGHEALAALDKFHKATVIILTDRPDEVAKDQRLSHVKVVTSPYLDDALRTCISQSLLTNHASTNKRSITM